RAPRQQQRRAGGRSRPPALRARPRRALERSRRRGDGSPAGWSALLPGLLRGLLLGRFFPGLGARLGLGLALLGGGLLALRPLLGIRLLLVGLLLVLGGRLGLVLVMVVIVVVIMIMVVVVVVVV